MTNFGARLVSLSALAGTAVSVYDYFNPMSGIAGTGGVVLVIVSTLILFLAGLVLAYAGPGFIRGFFAVGTLIGIAGTAFAAYLLESRVLLALMGLCLLGWLLYISRPRRTIAALSLLLALPGVLVATPDATAQQWPAFNGDLRAQKYSPLTQITPDNVKDLTAIWRVHTGDKYSGTGAVPELGLHTRPIRVGPKDTPPTVWSATPLFVNDTLYLGTPFYRIFAIEPDTGKIKWIYDTKAVLEALTQPDLKNRGVAYWQAETIAPGQPCQKRVFIGTMDAKLHSVDADTGKLCTDFGTDGVLDVNQWNTVNNKWPLSLLQPPTVYKDFLFVGWAGKDWADAEDPPGSVFALDVRTGAVRWTFHSIPPEIAPKTGTANVWASMSVDPERDLLYLPVSSPSPNFFGGNRLADIPLATSVTALRVATGEVAWSRQLVHHDIWDYDTNAAPTLVDITKDGRKNPALVQTSKQGFLYVLNRETGEPIYPVEERPVPKSTVPGEQAAPTQPYVANPKPVVSDVWPGVYWFADWVSFGYCSRKVKELKYEGRFTPPSLEGSLVYPGTIGGTEWGGGAVDPNKEIFVVNSSSAVQIYRLLTREDYNKTVSIPGRAETGGYFPMSGAPYGVQLTTFLNPLGMPCWNPPYGTIAAYDLKTGQQLWNKPFGQVQKYGFYMPNSWGSITIGAPVVTAGGLIFIGASMDSRVRALDLRTGDVVWQALVSAPAVAMPAVFEYKGKQYVVFAAGGNSILTPRVSDEIVAFALPN